MTGKVILSARMQAVADLVTKGNRVCDVGCDHGYVCIYLIQQKISPQVLAMDINKGPLSRAEEHVTRAGLKEYITLRRSDGLDNYRAGEAETLICAGMGGRLIQRILTKEPNKTKDFRELILQPQSEVFLVRRFLRNLGYSIISEDMILEEEKFYPMIKAVPGGGNETEEGNIKVSCFREVEDYFGPVLLSARHPALLLYLKKEWESCQRLKESLVKACGSPKALQRLEELEVRADYIKKAAQFMGINDISGGIQ